VKLDLVVWMMSWRMGVSDESRATRIQTIQQILKSLIVVETHYGPE